MADQLVSMLSPSGARFDVPANEVNDALKLGLRQESPEEIQARADKAEFGTGIGNEIKAGLAGAARGATFGLSDVIASDVGAGETFAKLQEQNPTASTIGEVAGAVGPALLSGGESVVASGAKALSAPVRAVTAAGRAVEQSVAKSIAGEATKKTLARQIVESSLSKGAGSAVEGAFYGAGQVVSEEALGRTDLTAEKALAHVGLSAVLGGVTGGLFGAGEELASEAVKRGAGIVKEKLGGGTIGESLDKFAEEQAVKSLNATQSKIQRLQNKDRLEEVGRDLLTSHEALGGKKILDSLGDMEKTANNIAVVKSHAGKMKGDALTELDAAARSIGADERKLIETQIKEAERLVKRRTGETSAQRDAQLALLKSEREDIVATLPKSKDGKVIGTESRYGHGTGAQKKLTAIDDEIAELEAGATRRSESVAAEGEKHLAALRKQLDDTHVSFNGAEVGKRFRSQVVDDSLQTPLFREEANKIADTVERFTETGRLTLKEADNLKQRLQAEAQRDYDKLTGQYSFAGEMRMKAAALVREEIENVAAAAAERTGTQEALARFTEGNRLFGSMAEAEKLVEQGVARKQGNRVLSLTDNIQSAGMFGGAVASGAAFAPAAIAGLATGVTHKFWRERGNAMAALFVDRMRNLATIERAAQATTSKIESAVQRFLTRESRDEVSRATRDKVVPAGVSILHSVSFGDGRARAAKADEKDAERTEVAQVKTQDAYRKRLTELAELASRPEVLTERLQRSLAKVSDAAPGIASHMQVAAARAANFLAAKAPKDPVPPSILGTKSDYVPPDSDLAAFARYVEAAVDPMTVMRDLDRGAVSVEGVEALKVLYPAIYEEVTQTIIANASQMKGELAYEKRVQLSILFDMPVDPTMSPAFVAEMQSYYAAEANAAAASPGAVRPTATGLSQLRLAEHSMTETQRLTA